MNRFLFAKHAEDRAPWPQARWLCCSLLTYRTGYASSLAPRQQAWGPAAECELISARTLRSTPPACLEAQLGADSFCYRTCHCCGIWGMFSCSAPDRRGFTKHLERRSRPGARSRNAKQCGPSPVWRPGPCPFTPRARRPAGNAAALIPLATSLLRYGRDGCVVSKNLQDQTHVPALELSKNELA